MTPPTASTRTQNTTYYTRVRARSHGSVETSTIGLTAVPTQAAVPASLVPVILSTGGISISWTVNNNPAGTQFRAQIATDADITIGVLSSGWITGTIATFTALSPNATYYARVQARNHASVITATDAVRIGVTLAKDPVVTDPVVLPSSDIRVRWDVG